MITGKTFSMGNQLTFSGSGELDNGLNVSLSFILDQGDDTATSIGAGTLKNGTGAPFDSHSVSVGMDGLGTLTFHGEGGSAAIASTHDLQLVEFGMLTKLHLMSQNQVTHQMTW